MARAAFSDGFGKHVMSPRRLSRTESGAGGFIEAGIISRDGYPALCLLYVCAALVITELI